MGTPFEVLSQIDRSLCVWFYASSIKFHVASLENWIYALNLQYGASENETNGREFLRKLKISFRAGIFWHS